MYIQWYGHACFRLQASNRDTALVTDPFSPSIGWRLPKLHADIVTISANQECHNFTDAIKKDESHLPFIITGPGEYEAKGIYVYGIPLVKKTKEKKAPYTTLYSFNIDDIFVGHMSELDRELTEHELDQLGRIDILLLPVGDRECLDPKTAIEVISQIEPRIVIPMQYKLPGLKLDQNPIDAFLKEYGVKDIEKVDKLKITKKELPAEETKIIALNPA
jgi:L-ascorbate metabolism protein UlaG (beta-lactamase superfamily)